MQLHSLDGILQVMVAAPALPDLSTLDADALRSLLLAKHSELIVQHGQLLSNNSEIEHLKLVIAKLGRMLFGAKSERVAREIEQLELKLEELETVRAERAVAQRTSLNDDAARPSRRPLPEHLPREVHTHAPASDACPECGELRKFGEDVSEMLEYVPSSFKVVRHVRPKLSCRGCEKVVQAEAPSRPIDRGIPGPGLLAHVLVAKYADHLPLYRQSEIYAREGVDLDRSTLADWVGFASKLLRPLIEEVRLHVTAATKLHADDTPVPVLAPGNGKTKTGRLWTYVRDDRPANDLTPPAVWFAYTPDRKGEHPRIHLAPFNGTLQAAMPGSIIFMTLAASARPPAGRMCGASSTTSRRHTARPSPPRPSNVSPVCMRSRVASAASRPKCDTRYASRNQDPCSLSWEAGSRRC